MRFRASAALIDRYTSKKNHFTILMVFEIILFLLFLFVMATGDLEAMAISTARDLDVDVDFLSVCFWLAFILVCVGGITHAIAVSKFSELIAKVEKSYVCIEDTKISGFGYRNEIGLPFSVEIKNVKSALCNGQSEGYNLILITNRDTYKCLAIAEARQAAQKINELVQNQPQNDKPPLKEKNLQTARNVNDKKCIFCGKYMPKTQVYCGSCGRRQD